MGKRYLKNRFLQSNKPEYAWNTFRLGITALNILLFALLTSGVVFAQGMPAPHFAVSNSAGMEDNMIDRNMVAQNDDEHTAREEAEGKEIWQKLQANELQCENLSDDEFGALGEYFMGQMAGEQHKAMNTMMIQMMGEASEKQMHIVMGKRMSGCETNAPLPQNMMNSGMMPTMMQMMDWGNNPMIEGWGQNPSWWGATGSWLVSILWLVWLVVGILAIIWLWKQIVKK